VVGSSQTASGDLHAFVTVNGVMTDLGTLGGEFSRAHAINDVGQVVGRSETPNGEYHAFVTVNGVMTDLGLLGGTSEASANAINNAGQVVGSSYNASADGISYAFVTVNGVMIDLGTLGGIMSSALDINNAGQVVGWSKTASGETHAFVTVDGVMTDLNALLDPADAAVWTLTDARAINDPGQIVGTGSIKGRTRAFLLTPVPLPAAVWLMGSALLGLVGLSRRNNSALAHG
jgi:probable HAF family extracellular repeat protein